MSDEQDLIAGEGESLPWSETWINALTKPSVATFEQIANDPAVTKNRAHNWIFIAAFISTLISIAINSLSSNPLTGSSGSGGGDSLIFTLLCTGLVAPLFSVLSIMIFAAVTQAIAGALGGTGTYTKLVYAFASYIAPLSLIIAALSIIPFSSLLTIPLGLYGIVLNLMANKAVNQFGWGKAIASSLILVIGLVTIVAVGFLVVLVLLGPAIGDLYSDIMTGL